MSALLIDSLDDARVAGYRNVRERDLRAEHLFIAEGTLLAERLLNSRYPVESLFTTPENTARFDDLLRGRAPLYVAQAALLRQITGFDFHRGVLSLARRLPFAKSADLFPNDNAPLKIIACGGVATAENLGMIVRSAAAFAINGVLLPQNGADPLSRRCLRQSMGSALTLPIALSENLSQDLNAARETAQIQTIAAVADDAPGVVALNKFSWPRRAVLLMGHEFYGIDDEWMQACDFRVTIPISPLCDSLNVAVAAGILLHHWQTTST
jgi:tRNA G18 (ribose-2'-O)-methylase SpoU